MLYIHSSACIYICVLLIKLLLDFDTAVFDATLPTTTSIIRGETEEERAEALAKTGKLASAGNMYRYLGSMMYNSKELLLARSIARENKHKEVQEREDREAEKEMALFKIRLTRPTLSSKRVARSCARSRNLSSRRSCASSATWRRRWGILTPNTAGATRRRKSE